MREKLRFLFQGILIFCGLSITVCGCLGFFESVKDIKAWPPSAFQPVVVCCYLVFFGLATIILEICGGKALDYFPYLNSFVGSGFFLLLVGILTAGTKTYGYEDLGVVLGSIVIVVGLCFFVVACFFHNDGPRHEPLLS